MGGFLTTLREVVVCHNCLYGEGMKPRNFVVAMVILVPVVALLSVVRLQTLDDFSCEAEPRTVLESDTLWGIAESKCDGNIQSVVDNLVDVYGTTIHAGDTIWLPLANECLLDNRGGQVYDTCG